MTWMKFKHSQLRMLISSSSLTWGWWLDLGSLVLFVVCKNLRRRVLATLDFALEGVQTLDVLFL